MFFFSANEEKKFLSNFSKMNYLLSLRRRSSWAGSLCVCVSVLDIFFRHIRLAFERSHEVEHYAKAIAITHLSELKYHLSCESICFWFRLRKPRSCSMSINFLPCGSTRSVSRWSLNLFKWNWFEDKKSVARPESEGKSEITATAETDPK